MQIVKYFILKSIFKILFYFVLRKYFSGVFYFVIFKILVQSILHITALNEICNIYSIYELQNRIIHATKSTWERQRRRGYFPYHNHQNHDNKISKSRTATTEAKAHPAGKSIPL